MKYEVIEYRSTADTYEVEANSTKEAEDLVGVGKGKLIQKFEEHNFYETYLPDVPPLVFKTQDEECK